MGIITAILLSTFVQAATTDWQETLSTESLKQWQHTKDNNLICATQIQKDVTKDQLKDFSKKNSDNIDLARKESLKFFGVTAWTKNSGQWLKKDSLEIYQIKGTYKNVSGDQIYFLETHFVDGSTYTQILVSDAKDINPDIESECLKLSGGGKP